ncbi:lipopolysaccharide biosynthesis protein [Flavobacterium sp. 120]|uniref:lipopolysaccharide biosynthesis protein n=1 Tax=Flavobacterium sp. 120 TaxID=2135626 RepID=UPI000EB50DF7|nr:polysaccharide biosynthesis protein [Flavobacterium sp. 120]RKS13294.1 O-antigen/teichoic acid export membrane protein [Flavobacterium sp. 120]
MKSKFNTLKQHPKYDTVINWGKLISITGSAQIILQAVGFVSGILVIRLLSTQEYALYTLANTMLGTMTILSDAGISTGVMAQGGKIWQNQEKLGSVVATGMDLRKKFAIVSLIVSLPILFYLLLHNDASLLMSIMISLSLIPAFYAALSDSLLEIVPKLHQCIVPLQKNQIVVSIGRLVLSAVSLFVFPWTFMAILASGLPRIYGNIKLKKISEGFIDTAQKPDPIVRDNILKVVKKSLPTLIFYSFSGQITIWIVSVFGNVTSIAQLGALGRIAILLNLFSVLIGTLVVPRFSRLENNISKLLLRYTQVLLICTVLMIVFAGGIYVFADRILWILGKNYSSLNFELFLIMISACLNVISGVAFGLYSSKGWILPPLYTILKTILVILVASFVFDLSTLGGALYLNILFSITAVFTDVFFGYYNILKIDSTSKS